MAPESMKKEQVISGDEKGEPKPSVATYTLDTAATLIAVEERTLTAEEAKRLRRKIDWHILPLMCSGSTFTFTFTLRNV